MTSISPEDRALIERTRRVNKTLSIFVFALQERSDIPTEGQLGIADMLESFAGTIRARAFAACGVGNATPWTDRNGDARPPLDVAVMRLQIDAPRGCPTWTTGPSSDQIGEPG